MDRSYWRSGAFVFLGLALLIPFQNCGKLSASKAESAPASSHGTPHIMRTSSIEAINTDITFRVHDESLPASVQFQWSFTLNGATSGCVAKSAANASTFVLQCTAPGDLRVTVSIDNAGEIQTLSYATILQAPAGTNQIPLEVVFEIPNGTNNTSWNSAGTAVEVFVGQKLKLKNMDSSAHQLHTGGRPCPHGNSIAPGATVDCVVSQSFDSATNGTVYDHNDGTSAQFHVIAYDGAALYSQKCAGCHGPLATSPLKDKTVSQIMTARSTRAPMIQNAAVQALTQRQIQAISYALGGR